MCEHDTDGRHEASSSQAPPPANADESFPWRLAVCDAHCHPTDTMAALESQLPSMRACVLAIMATRSQDQQLVADVASRFRPGPPPLEAPSPSSCCKVVPAFGWHPWFSHQLYDDTGTGPKNTTTYAQPPEGADAKALQDAKRMHYRAVLTPPPDDDAFIVALPTPSPLSSFLSASSDRLKSFPDASLVGEIGIDRAFRLPRDWDPAITSLRDQELTPGGREGRLLSRHRVCMPHQQAILRAQLRLAGELGRPVSVHGVQAPGILYDTVSACWKGHQRHIPSRRERRMIAPGAEDQDSDSDSSNREGGKPYPPRICLHSYSGTVEVLNQWMNPTNPSRVYVSFSSAVNLSTDAGRAKFPDVVRAVPDDRVLVESDLHMAGPGMDAALEDMYRRVCDAKGWTLEEGIRTIAQNFEYFIFGKGRR
ncbi:Cut9-interacting protein scn1 [Purpureocillium takamizusanense]|uniref:Cut9-interacting protein scn1 n=1 Tax=Purpureocillium takamizusanense TaxID=2060973 RepID=A0A9Q8QLV0_9HYPO|nr:Cut9-interacting protein scn1 [Purpureocillium takamizusanense]UNI22005.1 Cut9-interacting protein scn1 [Purpureocillium takamizusanense]